MGTVQQPVNPNCQDHRHQHQWAQASNAEGDQLDLHVTRYAVKTGCAQRDQHERDKTKSKKVDSNPGNQLASLPVRVDHTEQQPDQGTSPHSRHQSNHRTAGGFGTHCAGQCTQQQDTFQTDVKQTGGLLDCLTDGSQRNRDHRVQRDKENTPEMLKRHGSASCVSIANRYGPKYASVQVQPAPG